MEQSGIYDRMRSVSPVVGVILLVAVTVVLSAVVGTLTLNLAERTSSPDTPANIDVESSGTQEMTLTNMGDDLKTESVILRVSADGKSATVYPNGSVTGSLDVSVSGSFMQETWNSGEETSLLVTSPYSDEATVSVVDAQSQSIERSEEVSNSFSASDGPYQSCLRIKQAGASNGTGVYSIDPDGDGATFEVYCDMETAGGGWTLVSSRVDGSTFAGSGSDSGNGTTTDSDDNDSTVDWGERRSKHDTYIHTSAVGNVSTLKSQDTVLPSYYTVSFEEQMFVNNQSEWITYQIRGNNVTSWFKSLSNGVNLQTENVSCKVNNCTKTGNDIYEPTGTNLNASRVNDHGSLTIRFLEEDEDTYPGHIYHGFSYGPTWKRSNNCDWCSWDDAGTPWGMRRLGGDNNEPSTYIYWYVR